MKLLITCLHCGVMLSMVSIALALEDIIELTIKKYILIVIIITCLFFITCKIFNFDIK